MGFSIIQTKIPRHKRISLYLASFSFEKKNTIEAADQRPGSAIIQSFLWEDATFCTNPINMNINGME